MAENPLRRLPPVNAVLAAMNGGSAPHAAIADAVRAELDAIRGRLADGDAIEVSAESVAAAATARLRRARPNLRPVINATGVVLHTNLGRAPLAEVASDAARAAAANYVNLELDLAGGARSSRIDAVRILLCRLTGSESATCVNNCAAATVLVLRALAAGREAIVSRGELVEIGGGFRIPEVMAVSGATLREVGTTNITRIGDYERAVTPATALLMRVHKSNFRTVGFTESASLDDLVALGRRCGLPVADDIGSGALVDFERFGLTGEPTAAASVRAGADVVLFSGDKLLGGPQAGVIVGRRDIVERVERDPLMRAMRIDKIALAALEATLRSYLDERALAEVPALRMLGTPLVELRRRATALAERLSSLPGVAASVRDDVAFVGGGSLPEQALPTVVVAVAVAGQSEHDIARRLRAGDPPVVARLKDGRVRFDVRTVFPRQEDDLVAAVAASLMGGSSPPIRHPGEPIHTNCAATPQEPPR